MRASTHHVLTREEEIMANVNFRISAREVQDLDRLVELGFFQNRSDAVRHCVAEYLLRKKIEDERALQIGGSTQ